MGRTGGASLMDPIQPGQRGKGGAKPETESLFPGILELWTMEDKEQ